MCAINYVKQKIVLLYFLLKHYFMNMTALLNGACSLLQDLPPYNGFGSLEDSKQSCLSLIPQPPKKDFIKMLENDGKILRFAARMVSQDTLHL